MHFVDGVSIREIRRRTGLHRETIRRALAAKRPPAYRRRAKAPSKLDPFKEEIERLLRLRSDHRMPGTRIRELIAELGYEGCKTILDDRLREVRPPFAPKRTHQRTGLPTRGICQFDLWEPRAEIPVGHGQTRKGWVVTNAPVLLVRRRRGADLLQAGARHPLGHGRCLAMLGALPETAVWDREAAIAPKGRPTEAFPAFCGALPVGWSICEAEDPESKGVLERSHRFLRSNRAAASSLPSTSRPVWTIGSRTAPTPAFTAASAPFPVERLAEERGRMRPLPERMPDTDRRFACACPSNRICASTPTTTPWTRGRRAGVWRCASRSARSLRSSWAPEPSWHLTGAPLPGTSPSPTPLTSSCSTTCAGPGAAGPPAGIATEPEKSVNRGGTGAPFGQGSGSE